MRNYDLGIQDHGFSQIKITWLQDLLRSKPWDHGFVDHGSKKLKIVRSRDHKFWYFFFIQIKKINEITFPRSMDHGFSWSKIGYSEKIITDHISCPFSGVPAIYTTSESIENQAHTKWWKCQSLTVVVAD